MPHRCRMWLQCEVAYILSHQLYWDCHCRERRGFIALLFEDGAYLHLLLYLHCLVYHFKFKIQSQSVCLHSWLAKGTEACTHCAHPTRLCRYMLRLNGKCNLPFPEYHLQWLWMTSPGAPMHRRPSFGVSLVELLLGRFS